VLFCFGCVGTVAPRVLPGNDSASGAIPAPLATVLRDGLALNSSPWTGGRQRARRSRCRAHTRICERERLISLSY
jgi:hypothetical protein